MTNFLDGDAPMRQYESASKDIQENANLDANLKHLEKMWAKEHHEKPYEIREILTNELHGVSSRAVPETTMMIARALELFQKAVDNVPELEKKGYYRARSMKSTYIDSVPFRLKFLRAELFDLQKAALRFTRNLNYLLDKFGEFALMRQLYLSDLSNEEKKFLKKGYIQILPFRDSAGRRIITHLGSYGGLKFSPKTKERVGAYLIFAVLAEDETSQHKGAISIGLLTEEAIGSIQRVKDSDLIRMTQAMPLRYSGYHTCLPDSYYSRIIKAFFLTLVKGEIRLMSRIHIGTQIECDYKLRTFGIPTEYIPRSSTGTIKDSFHKTFLKTRSLLDDRRKAEACNNYRLYYSPCFVITPSPVIECPEVHSFLVRRNGAAWNYPGNIHVRSFLEEKLENQKQLQREFLSNVTDEIMALNIPILVYDDIYCWYTRVTKKEDIQKQILYTMREIRKRKKMNSNNQCLQSDVSTTEKFKTLSDDGWGKIVNGNCCLTRGDDDNNSVRPMEM